MEFPSKPAQHRVTILAFACLIAFASGCASPGPAHPPSLHLPRAVTDLAATRTGNDVALRWTTPDKTTDGLNIQPPLTAEICRKLPTQPGTCTPVKRLRVHPGPSGATDALPSFLTADPATLLTYRVQILNANGHSAGLSNPSFAAAGSAPPPVEDVKITPIRDGAMVEWKPQSISSFIDLDRTLVQATAPKKPSTKQPRQLTSVTPAEVHLQAGRETADPGGTIDPTAQRGDTYRYTAQRVRAVTLGGHALEIRSVPSPTITTLMRDIFPPATPSGLAAVPGTGSIDLSWEPNTEPDLSGYIVFRQPVASDGTLTAAPSRLTPTPIPASAFSDLTAATGQTYSYRIVAVDSAGNQSSPSADVRESRRSQ